MKNTLAYFNSNDGTGILALGEETRLSCDETVDLASIQAFISGNSENYVFAGLSYDLKEQTLGIASENRDEVEFPLALLWTPEVVVKVRNNAVETVLRGTLTTDISDRISAFFEAAERSFNWNATLHPRTRKEDYIATVEALKGEIQYGNIYEINYCQEFYDDQFELSDPEAAYFKWNQITQAPFSAYIEYDNFRVLCGSPERFIEKRGDLLSSQPIKGTSRRGATVEEDETLKKSLKENPKERSENVMIVDLVRNDLSKVAEKSSVRVDELFGVYTFKTVHQLISTISCTVRPNVDFRTILDATFPMGSMTGAPKKSAVSLIEKHENFRRGLYSGSIGYIAPNGDFDFNVVIRSLIYNQSKKYLSCAVGGAITIQSTPEDEYEECNVKVKTILDRMHA